MDSRTLAEKIVEYAGSAENVSRVAHCMTRLRITPRDESKVDEAAISKLEGVFKVLKVGGQYQIVLAGSSTTSSTRSPSSVPTRPRSRATSSTRTSMTDSFPRAARSVPA